jgi:hypothetical protein
MGLKKRRLSRSGAASHAIIATKDQQLVASRKERLKGKPSAFSGTSRSRRADGVKRLLSEDCCKDLGGANIGE